MSTLTVHPGRGGGKTRVWCRECSTYHKTGRCIGRAEMHGAAVPVLTMREFRKRERLEAQLGRQVSWEEFFQRLAV